MMPYNRYIFISLVLIVAVGVGILAWPQLKSPQENNEFDLTSLEATDFSRIGVLVINNPGFKPDIPYLIYEEPGKPALTTELQFDDLSMFVSGGRASVINIQETSWHGQRAAVEGIEKEGRVLVRKIKAIGEVESALAVPAGSLFIPWQAALDFMDQCRVERIMQTHALDVYLTLKSGERLRAVEPEIDDVFSAYGDVEQKCGKILLGTE